MTTDAEMIDRIASEARPQVEFGRLPVDGYEMHVMLDDLVQGQSYLAPELKEWYLELWMEDEFDMDDPYDVDALENVRRFAAMNPVVELDPPPGRLTWEQAQELAQRNRRDGATISPWGWGDDRYFQIHQCYGPNCEDFDILIDRRTGEILREDSAQVLSDLRPQSRKFRPFSDFTNATGWEITRMRKMTSKMSAA